MLTICSDPQCVNINSIMVKKFLVDPVSAIYIYIYIYISFLLQCQGSKQNLNKRDMETFDYFNVLFNAIAQNKITSNDILI